MFSTSKRMARYTYQIIRVCSFGISALRPRLHLIQVADYFWQTHKSSRIRKWFDLLPLRVLTSPAFLVRLEEVSSFSVMGMWRKESPFSRSSMHATNFASGSAFGCVLSAVTIPLNQCTIGFECTVVSVLRSTTMTLKFKILTCDFDNLTLRRWEFELQFWTYDFDEPKYKFSILQLGKTSIVFHN